MKNVAVFIITGEDMKETSNQLFELKVANGSDHTFVLEQFIVENKIDYPYWDYYFSHDAVKLAIMGNIVILTGGNIHIIALPDTITEYQRERTTELSPLFNNETSVLSIMNIDIKEEKHVYEGISSTYAKEVLWELVDKKYQKWKTGRVKKIEAYR